MKNSISKGLWVLMLLVVWTSCAPQENDDYSLGSVPPITVDQVNFTYTTSAVSNNVLTFTSNVDFSSPYSVYWDLGNGSSSKERSVTAQYPLAGDYTVKLTVYSADGTSATRSMVVRMANSDFSLINTPAYVNLTGGTASPDGKVWVFDQYNNYSKEVATALGKDIRGHMGLAPTGNYDQNWWGAQPNEKSKWKMYDFKFIFIQNGVKLKIENAGLGYGRRQCVGGGGFTADEVDGEDATFNYAGGNYTFSMNESGKYPVITLSGNAFMGYYCGSQEYEIIYQTADVMALKTHNPVENHDWIFIYCREELNVSTPPIVKVPKAIPLADSFEGTSLTWVAEEMGGKSGIVDNPAPVPVNESAKVYRYQKSNSFYSNLSFTAATYKFDLTKQNKIRLKVFIPSYNDYTTEFEVAGPWISNTKLLPQLAVKLQNSSMGGNAWETQAEIVKADLVKDKWIELEYDFSPMSSRTDFDKIVIQFGAEGHAGPGIFFFDDFTFSE